MLRRTHPCDRCGAGIDPGDVYAAIDGVDAEGRIRVLLCRSCASAFRSFLDAPARRAEDDGPGRGEPSSGE